MTGQRLGPRSNYLYQTEVPAIVYIVTADDTLAGLAGVGAGNSAAVEYDPENPPAGKTVTPAPKRFVPRTIFAQSTDDGARKELIAFDPTASLYVTSAPASVPSIDSDATFVTTGRKGEKISF